MRSAFLQVGALCAAALVVAGCNSSPTPGDPQNNGTHLTGIFSVTPAAVWAGGTVQVRSADFAGSGVDGTIQFGDSAIALVRVDDSTMTARVPGTLGGAVTPAVRLSAAAAPVNANAITVYGFVEVSSYEEQIPYDAYAWPRGGHAKIMGAGLWQAVGGGWTSGLTLIDLDTKSSTNYPGLINADALRGPGATYADGVFILKGSVNGPVEAWQLLPTPTLLESHPEVIGSRQVMRLGPSTWFTSTSHLMNIPGSGSVQAEETEGVFISPRKDRATMTVDHVAGLPGVPVLSMPDGQVAYTVSALQSAQGVDFSADGSLLAMVGGDTGWPEGNARVALLNAATGAVMHDTTLGRRGFAITFDPVRPLVYVGTERLIPNASVPVIVVLDRTTFNVLGEMTVPASAPTCFLGCYKGVLALSDAPALYMFWSYNGSARAYKFSVPPAAP